jgi:hypothetical protein
VSISFPPLPSSSPPAKNLVILPSALQNMPYSSLASLADPARGSSCGVEL